MIHSNGPDVHLTPPDAAPFATEPRLRRVQLRGHIDGALYTTTPGSFGPESAGLRVTGRGHWYRTDADKGPDGYTCRGCGATGPDDAALDRQQCTHRPTAQDISNALPGRKAVPA